MSYSPLRTKQVRIESEGIEVRPERAFRHQNSSHGFEEDHKIWATQSIYISGGGIQSHPSPTADCGEGNEVRPKRGVVRDQDEQSLSSYGNTATTTKQTRHSDVFVPLGHQTGGALGRGGLWIVWYL